MPEFQSILMPVPEAEAIVGPFREDGDWSSAHGVSPHITLAGPWPLSLRLPTLALEDAAAAIRGTQFALAEVGALGDAICLFPEDDGKLLRWRASILSAVGAADAVDEKWRPHLTVCRGVNAETIQAVERAISPGLPLDCEVPGLLLAQLVGNGDVKMREL